MKSMVLTAKSYADLKPFEMMAKRFGIAVEFADDKSEALLNYRALARESRSAAQKAGFVPDDVNKAIKEVRKNR